MNTYPLDLPMQFRETLAGAGMLAIDEWWTHLDASSRSEALQLWHDCGQADSAFTVRVEARFEDEQDEEAGDFWHSDYYEYLVNHEVYLFEVQGIHICTRHPAAAAAVRTGVIPRDFCCPLHSTDCPMRQALGISPGRSLRLSVALRAANRMPHHVPESLERSREIAKEILLHSTVRKPDGRMSRQAHASTAPSLGCDPMLSCAESPTTAGLGR